MYSKGTGSSNPPLSAINFKGLLKSNKPFFRASIAFMRDSMRDVLKNACGLPVDAKVMQIDFCGADVHVSKHLLRPARTNAARDLAQFSARFGTPLTCASIVLAHCMQRARRKISRLSAFRLSELHAYSRYHFWASCSGTSPYSPLSDSKSQIPLFNFFARPI